jgi:hypothetical protein
LIALGERAGDTDVRHHRAEERRCGRCGRPESALEPFGPDRFAAGAHAEDRLLERNRWAADADLAQEEFNRLPLEFKRDYLDAIHRVTPSLECRECYFERQPQSEEGYSPVRPPFWW